MYIRGIRDHMQKQQLKVNFPCLLINFNGGGFAKIISGIQQCTL